MDFVKIKNMVRKNGDKVILMEHDEPEIVVMSFAEYEKLAHLQIADTIDSEKIIVRRDMQNHHNAKNSFDDESHETEFVAPVGTAPIRTASLYGNERIGREERKETRMSDIRLEDLPI